MAAATIRQTMSHDKAPIVDNLSTRMVAVETQMTGFDRRMSSMESTLGTMSGKLQEFIETANMNNLKPSFDPIKILQFLLMGATLIALLSSGIIYIARAQGEARDASAQTQMASVTARLAVLETAYVADLKSELAEWRKRYGWRSEIVSSR